jgi:hypothetical protein
MINIKKNVYKRVDIHRLLSNNFLLMKSLLAFNYTLKSTYVQFWIKFIILLIVSLRVDLEHGSCSLYVPADARFPCDKAAALEGKTEQSYCVIMCCDENRNSDGVRVCTVECLRKAFSVRGGEEERQKESVSSVEMNGLTVLKCMGEEQCIKFIVVQYGGRSKL